MAGCYSATVSSSRLGKRTNQQQAAQQYAVLADDWLAAALQLLLGLGWLEIEAGNYFTTTILLLSLNPVRVIKYMFNL
jgi:hypothetical protein